MSAFKPKRVLLMYISKVSGHRQATVAISKSLKSLNPDCEIMSINGFGYTYPMLEQIINKAYMGVIKRTPQLWEYLYDNPKVMKRSEKLKAFLQKRSHKKIAKLFEEFRPDVVICTQAFPCSMVADYKETYKVPVTIVGVLTDFAPHLYWLHPGVDYYVVPSPSAQERYVKEGIPAEKIKVFGIPIRAKFAENLDRAKVAAHLGLDPKVSTVLIMGGGQGLGPMKEAVKSLIPLDRELQLIVITGTNVKLYHWLKKQQRKTKKKIIIYDYASNVDELMTVADLIVSKPGGLTTSECLAKGLPMVIIDPIPGQEERNAQFLVSNNIAIRVDDKRTIGQAIAALLEKPDQIRKMRESALSFGKPMAADNIARFVLTAS